MQEARDAQLRALAEMENVRKRAQRDVESAHRFAVERFAADMIEVRDTLELGHRGGRRGPGSRQVRRGLAGHPADGRQGVREGRASPSLDPVGQSFNPEFHEAMVAQPTADHPAGSVLAVVQKGFTLNGRLLRPARVVIARAPGSGQLTSRFLNPGRSAPN